LTITGESNRINTPHRGRGYLRKMAEKRAFDIAVLEHLGLYSSIFSEEESTDFEEKKEKEPDLMPGTQEFESIVKEINAILDAKELSVLKITGRKIRNGIKIKKYTEKQIKYLRELYQREYGKKSNEF
jgi:thymidylate synthase